jgi:hypothetical protein
VEKADGAAIRFEKTNPIAGDGRVRTRDTEKTALSPVYLESADEAFPELPQVRDWADAARRESCAIRVRPAA